MQSTGSYPSGNQYLWMTRGNECPKIQLAKTTKSGCGRSHMVPSTKVSVKTVLVIQYI